VVLAQIRRNQMRKPLQLSVAVSALAFTALTFAPVALANSAHFIGTPTCTKSLSTGLTCSGKAAGLGNGPTFASLTAGKVEATYVCVNHGGNVAPGQPILEQKVSGPTQEITPHNGAISFSPNIPPPTPPSATSDCPSGKWKVRLTSLTYTGVVLTVAQPETGTVLTENFGTIDP
jgi:hypothetical protein